jgi:hypothetical protein
MYNVQDYNVLYNKVFRSTRFTYRLVRLKSGASQFRGRPTKMYNISTLLLDLHTYAVTYIFNLREAEADMRCIGLEKKPTFRKIGTSFLTLRSLHGSYTYKY